MCSCAPRPTSPDLATSPRSRCTSHTYQISPYLPLTSARCAPRPTRTTFCSGSPRPADESGGEMRLRAAGPHFCACVRSFRGCALRGARHEAPSLRLLCVIGLSRVRNEKECRATTARSTNRVVAMVQHPHTLRCNWHTTHICKRPKTRETHSQYCTVCGAAGPTNAGRDPRCTSLLHARCASRAQLISGGRGTGARRGCRWPLRGPARSVEVEVILVAVSPGRSDGLLGGVVEVVVVNPARAEGQGRCTNVRTVLERLC